MTFIAEGFELRRLTRTQLIRIIETANEQDLNMAPVVMKDGDNWRIYGDPNDLTRYCTIEDNDVLALLPIKRHEKPNTDPHLRCYIYRAERGRLARLDEARMVDVFISDFDSLPEF